MRDTVVIRSALESQLQELDSRSQRISEALSEPLSADSAERVSEMEDDAGLEAEQRLIAQEIASVQRALVRLQDGTYGECIHCGEKISDGRLVARPEAALCIDCASKSEAQSR